MTVEPFSIHVPEPVLSDLRERIARTRWPPDSPGAGWEHGTSPDSLRALLEPWRSVFDWRRQERSLNGFRQFRADVDRISIHFIHERGEGERRMPLLVTHGWPSTFFEMTKLVPRPSERRGLGPREFSDLLLPLPVTLFSIHARGA